MEVKQVQQGNKVSCIRLCLHVCHCLGIFVIFYSDVPASVAFNFT